MIYLIITIIVCLIILAAIFISHYENKHITTKDYTCLSDKLKEDVRIVFMSDLHDNLYGQDQKHIFDILNDVKPDVVLIGGDMFTGLRNQENNNIISLLKGLSIKFETVYAIGNHEHRYFLYPEKFPGEKEKLCKILSECNIPLIDNEVYKFRNCNSMIDIYGLTIDNKYYKRFRRNKMVMNYLSYMLPEKKSDHYNILLAHNPKYFTQYNLWSPDLVLSGHYHGGLIRFGSKGFISPSFKLFPKNSYGRFKKTKSEMIVSGGMGSHAPSFRIFNKPEIVIIDLKKKG